MGGSWGGTSQCDKGGKVRTSRPKNPKKSKKHGSSKGKGVEIGKAKGNTIEVEGGGGKEKGGGSFHRVSPHFCVKRK